MQSHAKSYDQIQSHAKSQAENDVYYTPAILSRLCNDLIRRSRASKVGRVGNEDDGNNLPAVPAGA
jgi:hypothetical protein